MKKRNIVILILIIFLIFLYYTLKKDFFVYQDDLIFFNFFNSYNKSKKQTDKYKIEVSKGIQNYKINNLWTTIDKKTLLNEKVAPGTKGNFEIILVSNYKIKYKIDFSSPSMIR